MTVSSRKKMASTPSDTAHHGDAPAAAVTTTDGVRSLLRKALHDADKAVADSLNLFRGASQSGNARGEESGMADDTASIDSEVRHLQGVADTIGHELSEFEQMWRSEGEDYYFARVDYLPSKMKCDDDREEYCAADSVDTHTTDDNTILSTASSNVPLLVNVTSYTIDDDQPSLDSQSFEEESSWSTSCILGELSVAVAESEANLTRSEFDPSEKDISLHQPLLSSTVPQSSNKRDETEEEEDETRFFGAFVNFHPLRTRHGKYGVALLGSATGTGGMVLMSDLLDHSRMCSPQEMIHG